VEGAGVSAFDEQEEGPHDDCRRAIALADARIAELEADNANLRAEVALVEAGRANLRGDREEAQAEVVRLEAENALVRQSLEWTACEMDSAWLAAWDAEWRYQFMRASWIDCVAAHGEAWTLLDHIAYECGRGASGTWAAMEIAKARGE